MTVFASVKLARLELRLLEGRSTRERSMYQIGG